MKATPISPTPLTQTQQNQVIGGFIPGYSLMNTPSDIIPTNIMNPTR
jgi:hypothetical protein